MKNHKLDQLRGQLAQWERNPPKHLEAAVSTGSAALDGLLPDGGLRSGTLVEWLTGSPGDGAVSLALGCAREVCRRGGALVMVDPARRLYPPALATGGIDLKRTIVVSPHNRQLVEWATVQALRSPAVAAVWVTLGRIDSHAFRRLQLAARSGDTLGLLVRPVRTRGEPTWSDVQLLVEPLAGFEPRRFRATVVRCRGGKISSPVELEIDDLGRELHDVRRTDDSYALPVATQLAHPTPAPHQAGT